MSRQAMPTYRAARRSDAAALAVLIDIAGEGLPAHLWRSLAAPGQSVLEIGRARAARDTGGFSWRNATVAEVDGEVAALLVDYRLDDPYDVGDLTALPPFVRPLVELESRAPGAWYVNVLATFAEFRRHGIGSHLLAIADERAAAAGARHASIIVAEENAQAGRLYRGAGYVATARAPALAFDGAARAGDWILMTKPIGR